MEWIVEASEGLWTSWLFIIMVSLADSWTEPKLFKCPGKLT
jgi:hypothetical protein